MIEAWVLYAALATTDYEVRASDNYQLALEMTRFPSPELCYAWVQLAADHRDWLECRVILDSDICPELGERLRNQNRIVRAYEYLENARKGTSFCYFGRLANVASLRNLIGEENYYFGRMPHPIPR